MTEPSTLFDRGDSPPPFNALDHRLYKRFVDGAGLINHREWLRALAERQWVGTCRKCGDYLIPQRPYEVSHTRTDYEAVCRDKQCRWTCQAPNGRYAQGSTRKSERKG